VSENIRLQVNIENLTDTTYFPNSHSTHQVTVGAPLNARFAISGQF
jgi:catecholate siderophore receptor